MSAAQALEPLRFPLWGSRLIEASAGTGKTWTIAALYLRLVLGHGDADTGFGTALRPDQILVMTFTRAATRELSDRIRARLVEAARAFRGQPPADPAQPYDSLILALLAEYPDAAAREQAAWRLALAAEGMDEAAVHTIDAWCQRMLREHAFDSGSLFDEELVPDEQALLLDAVQDYWRQQLYPLDDSSWALARQAWPDLASLHQDVCSLISQALPDGAGHGSLAEVLMAAQQTQAEALQALRAGWAERADTLQAWLDAQVASKAGWNGRSLQARYYQPWLQALRDWACGRSPGLRPELKTGWERLTPEGVRGMRQPDAPPISVPPEFAALAQLAPALDALPTVAAAARLHAAAQVRQRLAELKLQRGQFGFADLQARLNTALAGPQGARLRAAVLQQSPVALIDEFQDTSALQFQLFDALYRCEAHERHSSLLLIGDPKQSIYRFRGADIHSYLAARRATAGRHYVLGTNHRSTEALVAAVNAVFMRAEQRPGGGAFDFRDASAPVLLDGAAAPVADTGAGSGADGNPVPFLPVAAKGRAARWVDAQGPRPALTLQWDDTLHKLDSYLRHQAWRCAEQIVGWLNDPDNGLAEAGQPLQRLRPADIAVLVRNGREATLLRRALRERGVASVYLSDRDSVFASDEAQDLLRWLQAVAAPTDMRLVRAALATRLLDLPLAELARLAQDDEAFDARCEQLRSLQHVWRSQGVLALVRQSLHQQGLPARWLAQTGGERRLTNVMHLAELLQQASQDADGEQALIRWFSEAVAQALGEGHPGRAGTLAEEATLRLESDADLVKVVTIHKSKGLEYPVVCLPFIGSFRVERRGRHPVVALSGPGGATRLDLNPGEAAMAVAERERLREDLRLLYVALTRARHGLWLGLAPLSSGRSPKPANHLSAWGYLMTGPEPADAETQAGALRILADAQPGIVCVAAPAQPERRQLQPRAAAAVRQAGPAYAAQFDRRWSIASFSALVRALGPAPVGTLLPRPADDEMPPPAALVAASPALMPPLASAAAAETVEAPWHQFERGAIAGNFLHDQLEWLAGEGFALGRDPALMLRLQRRCERAGRAEQAGAVQTWLQAVVNLRLPGPDVALSGLQQVLPEMEFWLPATQLPAERIDALCREHLLPGLPRPALPARQLHGMLMGFADLVFEQGGRYWVLDYKSNQLGLDGAAYTESALAAAMAEHRYDVQAGLYLLALHRLLRARLGPAYVPSLHLGGAVYLFLRGIDGPCQGVCTLAPPLALLDALDALLREEELPYAQP